MLSTALTVHGLTEATGALRELAHGENGPKTVKGIVRKGVRAGGKVLLAKAQSLAPDRTGRLKGAVKMTSWGRHGLIAVSIGVRQKNFPGKVWYATFEIWGHKTGRRGGVLAAVARIIRILAKRKQVAPDDFLTLALMDGGDAAADKAAEIIVAEVEKALSD